MRNPFRSNRPEPSEPIRDDHVERLRQRAFDQHVAEMLVKEYGLPGDRYGRASAALEAAERNASDAELEAAREYLY